jgi:glycosyltransferase involved in cell wall biosynthesis
MLQACAEAGMPAAIYFHGLEFEDWVREGRAPPARFKASQVVANSQFTAERLASLWGIRAEVIRPYFKRELYQTTTSREVVTFINPVREKGVELALAIAAECPNIPFEFVQGWPLPIRDRFRLRKRLRRLPNVSLRPIAEDMRRVYQRSRLLIVPSHWERETWGRVATEAQFSGIPVIAMNVGGLPEAVGSGGVLLGREAAAEGWAQEIRRLWSCEVAYGHLSQAAARHAEREEIWPSYQVRHLLRVLDEARAHPSR